MPPESLDMYIRASLKNLGWFEDAVSGADSTRIQRGYMRLIRQWLHYHDSQATVRAFRKLFDLSREELYYLIPPSRMAQWATWEYQLRQGTQPSIQFPSPCTCPGCWFCHAEAMQDMNDFRERVVLRIHGSHACREFQQENSTTGRCVHCPEDSRILPLPNNYLYQNAWVNDMDQPLSTLEYESMTLLNNHEI